MKLPFNEHGLAMLEAVIATAIIGVLASIALPKLGNMLDTVYLDYEIRGLHSMIHYTQSSARLSTYKTFGCAVPKQYDYTSIECLLVASATGANSYQVRKRDNSDKRLKEKRVLERGFFLSLNKFSSSLRFSPDGNLSPATSSHISIEKRNLYRYLVLTGYGRARISLTPPPP